MRSRLIHQDHVYPDSLPADFINYLCLSSSPIAVSKEDLKKSIRDAVKNYVDGIRFVPYTSIDGTPLMAGYLGLKKKEHSKPALHPYFLPVKIFGWWNSLQCHDIFLRLGKFPWPL